MYDHPNIGIYFEKKINYELKMISMVTSHGGE
jgi:hypothetical protein